MNDVQILGDISAEFASEQNVTIGKWFGKSCLKVDENTHYEQVKEFREHQAT